MGENEPLIVQLMAFGSMNVGLIYTYLFNDMITSPLVLFVYLFIGNAILVKIFYPDTFEKLFEHEEEEEEPDQIIEVRHKY